MKKQIQEKSLATASGAPVSAQALEEIVLTATKRQESIQDVVVSVSAMTGEQLGALGLGDMADITQQFPGFQVRQIPCNGRLVLTTWTTSLTARD